MNTSKRSLRFSRQSIRRRHRYDNKRRNNTSQYFQPSLERLEDRALLAGDITINDSTLVEGSEATVALGPYVAAQSGGLDGPTGIVIGPHGDLFVAGSLSDNVVRYDRATGALLEVFVAPGSGGLDEAHGLAFGTDGNLYVGSVLTNSVLRYDGTTGAFMDAFVPSSSGGLNTPKDIKFGPDGNLYVASRETGQILMYQGLQGASPGSFLGVFAYTGANSTPNYFAWGPDGHLYVGLPRFNTPEPNDGRVDRFNGITGEFIDTFIPTGVGGMGGGNREILFDPPGNMYVADPFQNAIVRFQGPNGQSPGAFIDMFVPTGLGELNKPMGALFDPDGNLVVASRDRDNVLRYGAASQAVFTVNLNSVASVPVTVSYSAANGIATAGIDFTTVSGQLTFAPGETSHVILVQSLDDMAYEGNETFVVNLTNPVGGVIADGQGVATIQDNEPEPLVSISDATATEGSAVMKFMDTFISSGSGGLKAARGIDYGPDGNLYVSRESSPNFSWMSAGPGANARRLA